MPMRRLLRGIATLLGVYVAIEIGILAIAIAAKWLLLGRTKPGRYPLWGTYFYRWWLVERLLSLIPIKTFPGHADHALLSARARREDRQGCAHRRSVLRRL